MTENLMIGADLAKNVIHLHGATMNGHMLFRKRVSRAQFLRFIQAQPRCVVVMEACAGAHHWARELTRFGHEARLIAPGYVKPFLKRQKNDANDAEAIVEAAQRPGMRYVKTKTRKQQATACVFRVRKQLVETRTALINAMRSHLYEFGFAFPVKAEGIQKAQRVLDDRETDLPDLVRVSKAGQADIRKLLIRGAMSRLNWAGRRATRPGSWLARMLERKPRMLVVIALANKMARAVWAMIMKGEDYRDPASMGAS